MIWNSLGRVSAVDSNVSSLLAFFWFQLCIEQSWKGLKGSSIHPSARWMDPYHPWQVFVYPIKNLQWWRCVSSSGNCANASPSSPSAGFTLMSYLAFHFFDFRLLLFCPILWNCRTNYSFLFCNSSLPCWRPLSPSSVGETTLSSFFSYSLDSSHWSSGSF